LIASQTVKRIVNFERDLVSKTPVDYSKEFWDDSENDPVIFSTLLFDQLKHQDLLKPAQWLGKSRPCYTLTHLLSIPQVNADLMDTLKKNKQVLKYLKSASHPGAKELLNSLKA
jgi:hypothetical protein